MNTISYCYIHKEYFLAHPDYINLLDENDNDKQGRRLHLSLEIQFDGNKYYVPLRNNLGAAERKFGRIGHLVPSEKRPKAGLDFRHTLIVNDPNFIDFVELPKIPKSQQKIIEREYTEILNEFKVYIRKFKRVNTKNRLDKEPLFRASSLLNYTDIL